MRSKVTGIYSITNVLTAKVYIGSSNSVRDRWYQHRCDLRQGKHHSVLLQRAWDKYGEDAFRFEVIEKCSPAELFDREAFHLADRDSANPKRGYNTLLKPGSGLGYRHTDEARARMSKSHLAIPREKRLEFCRSFVGKSHSPETRAKMAASARERWKSPELRERISARLRGKKRSEEDRRKMREGIARRRGASQA